jgi:ribosomal protein S21
MIFVRNGDIERAIRTLRNQFKKTGVEKELRDRRFFMSLSERRRMERKRGMRKFREAEREQLKGD